jgi:hypothetical protein
MLYQGVTACVPHIPDVFLDVLDMSGTFVRAFGGVFGGGSASPVPGCGGLATAVSACRSGGCGRRRRPAGRAPRACPGARGAVYCGA